MNVLDEAIQGIITDAGSPDEAKRVHGELLARLEIVEEAINSAYAQIEEDTRFLRSKPSLAAKSSEPDTIEIYAPEVAGPFAWAQAHAWANNIRDWICPVCGEFAVKMVRAMHDLVNLKLGKQLRTPDEFAYIGGLFARALRGEQPFPAEEHAKLHSGKGAAGKTHLHPGAQAVDLTDGNPPLEELLDPDGYEAFKIELDGDHGHVYGCPAGKFDQGASDCIVAPDLQAIIHPREEDGLLEEEAFILGVPIHANDAVQEISPTAIASFLEGLIV